jgi:hypothetical protein
MGSALGLPVGGSLNVVAPVLSDDHRQVGRGQLRTANLAQVHYPVGMLPLPAQVLLETLPSWPAVHEPSMMELLTLILFIPLVIAALFGAVVLGPAWRSKGDDAS